MPLVHNALHSSSHIVSVCIIIVLVIFIVPGQPSVSIGTRTSTSISLSGSVLSGSVVTSYEVMWQRDTSGECPDEDEGSTTITDDSTSYMHVIIGLEEGSSYTISVTAANAAGSSEVSETAMTEEAGERYPLSLVMSY